MALIGRAAAPARDWELHDPLTGCSAALAVVGTGGVIGAEVAARLAARLARRCRARPTTCSPAAGEAIGQTVEVAVEGIRGGSLRENALLSLLVSFNTFWLLDARHARTRSAGAARSGRFATRGSAGRHVHHFVPGIALMLLAGGGSIASARRAARPVAGDPVRHRAPR